MKKFLISAVALFILSANVNASGSCKHSLQEKNYYSIASDIAEHAFEGHEKDFEAPAKRKPNKKIPWVLSNENELAQFIEDIINEREVASRDKKTPLKVEKSKPLAGDRIAWIEKNTGTFVVFDPSKSACGSAYRDDHMEKYFNGQT